MLQELKSVIGDIPEIEELVGSEEANQVFCISEHNEEKVKSAVRTIFTVLMSAGPDTTKAIVFKLKRRLHMESHVSHGTSMLLSTLLFICSSYHVLFMPEDSLKVSILLEAGQGRSEQ
ncbi:unnamed protein product [Microthlaspi erraticum]|uniref:Uncharacterized protein n=1 Tax=Microthlaspi erraticum TaxID=1685480 RepID=A0A6D2I683_9BRAS|nr:unnamed protein product [Microthlaspi erraticum]